MADDAASEKSVPVDHIEHLHGHGVVHDIVEVTDVAAGDGDFKLTFGKMMAISSFVLGPSVSYTWIVASLTVGGAALAPIIGRFGDIFGRRYYLLAGNAIAMVGTATSATANNVNTLIAGGVLIGVATAMRHLAWACLGEIVPKNSRGVAFAFMQQFLSIGQAFGPVIAFTFIQHYSWRPVYWFPFALDAAALVLVFFFYHPVNQYIHEEGRTAWDQVKDSDWIGVLLFTAGIVLFLLGISFGGTRYSWRSAGTIAPILVGVCLLVACGLYEAYMLLKYPIFPNQIFRNTRGFTVFLAATFLLGMLYYAIAVLWPSQVQALYADTPLEVGWYSSAGGLGGLLFSPFYGFLQKYLKRSNWQLLLYTILMTICAGCLATVTPTSNVSSTALTALTFGFVSGVSIFSISMIQVGVEHAYIGIASGVVVTARSLGGGIATTIYLSVLSNHLAAKIPTDVGGPLIANGVEPRLIPGIIKALAAGDITSPALAALTPQALGAAIAGFKLAYASSFRLIYLISIGFGVVGTVVVAFAADVDHLMTSRIDIKLEEGAHLHAKMDTGEGHIIRHIQATEMENRV